jgi:hypothetical protein
VSNYQRTINPGIDVTNSPPNEGQGQGEGITHVSSGRTASANPREFVAANPVRSGGEEEEEEEEEEAIRNRIIRLRMARLFPGIEATGQSMPKSTTSITKSIPGLGNTTTKTPGFGKLSPSGTGLKDQPEEEEEEERYIHKRANEIDTKRQARREAGSFDKQEEEEEEEERRHLARSLSRIYMSRAQREQGMKPSLDQPDEKPQGEEEEEVRGPSLRQEEEDAMNPLAKAAGANVPQEQYNTAPDIVPIEGTAPALALGVGQTLWHQYIRRNTQPSEQQLKQMMEGWNQLRQPKTQPLPKLRLNMKESAVPVAPRGSASAIPTLPGVPARGMMSNNGTLSQPYQTAFHADTRAVQKWGLDKLQELDKRPYQQRPFDQYNSAHALYRQYLAEHMVTN